MLRAMANVPTYAARFSYARLVADCGRVLAGAALPLAIGVIVLGVLPVGAASLPWWKGTSSTPPETFRRVWVAVNTAKAVVDWLALSALALFTTIASLKVLTRSTWTALLQARRLTAGAWTAVGMSLLVNWPALATPLVATMASSRLARGAMSWIELVDFLAVMLSAGIALPVAVAEETPLLPAIVRAFRLLAGLRWRVASLCLAYLIASGVLTVVIEVGLASGGISYFGPGLGAAALRVPTILVGALNQIALVGVFLQGRRIADGPSAVELHEVFA